MVGEFVQAVTDWLGHAARRVFPPKPDAQGVASCPRITCLGLFRVQVGRPCQPATTCSTWEAARKPGRNSPVAFQFQARQVGVAGDDDSPTIVRVSCRVRRHPKLHRLLGMNCCTHSEAPLPRLVISARHSHQN
jgi:hypothetical protein